MRVLITGAGGFIGSHLVDSQVEQGNTVRAVDLHLDLLEHQSAHPGLEVIQGDITDKHVLKKIIDGVEVVYHLASAHLDVSLPDEHYRRVNVEGTVSLLDAARNAGVKRFVHCSSVGVIGDVEHPPANESTECHPTNIYERTKLEGERAALAYSHQTGFPVVVIRPAWVYGPRCPRTAKLIRTISKGRFLFFGSGNNLRHPVYISDAVKGLELGARAEGVNGEVFIIAGETAVPVSELVEVISKAMGAPTPRFHLPLTLGVVGGFAVESAFKLIGKQPPFSRRSVDFFRKHNAYSIDKAKRMLGYHPQTALTAGMQKTMLWHQANQRGSN